MPFLDVVCNEMKSQFSQDTRAYYELCALIPEVVVDQSDTEVEHLSQSKVKFEGGELLEAAVTRRPQDLRNFHADATFYPNVRELLQVHCVLPIGSIVAEKSFSCVRRVHNWLRNAMSTERLGDLTVVAMHGNAVPVLTADICQMYMELHPRQMIASSLFMEYNHYTCIYAYSFIKRHIVPLKDTLYLHVWHCLHLYVCYVHTIGLYFTKHNSENYYFN